MNLIKFLQRVKLFISAFIKDILLKRKIDEILFFMAELYLGFANSKLDVESYCGLILYDSRGEIIGLFSAMEKNPPVNRTHIELFNKGLVKCEMKIIEMKEEINRLYIKLGLPPRYTPIWFEDKNKRQL